MGNPGKSLHNMGQYSIIKDNRRGMLHFGI